MFLWLSGEVFYVVLSGILWCSCNAPRLSDIRYDEIEEFNVDSKAEYKA